MARWSFPLRRIFAAVVLAGVLVAQDATGEARAAVVTPPPDGDPDAADGSVRAAGMLIDPCDGDFGRGKDPYYNGASTRSWVVVDGLTNDDWNGISSSFFSIGTIESVQATELPRERLLLELHAVDCSRDVDGVFAPTEYAPPESLPLTLQRDGVDVCAVALPTPAWWRETLNSDPAQFWLWSYDTDGALSVRSDFADEAAHRAAYTALLDSAFGTEPDETDFVELDDYLSARDAWRAALPQVDCRQTSDAPATHPVAVTCEPAVVPVGAFVTCTVTGGDPGIDILWRASASPAFAEAGVTLDAAGRGTFTFQVPATVGDGPILVELVDWDRSTTVTIAGTLVPARVPAGGGPRSGAPLAGTLLLLGFAVVLTRARRQRAV
jgi:hypothetical protein